jgi:hypothetical protein
MSLNNCEFRFDKENPPDDIEQIELAMSEWKRNTGIQFR